jgi:hypothetical protein
MIRKRSDLLVELENGMTVSRLLGFGGLNEWRWCVTETSEPVHGAALKWALANDRLAVIQRDICGEPMQYGRPVPSEGTQDGASLQMSAACKLTSCRRLSTKEELKLLAASGLKGCEKARRELQERVTEELRSSRGAFAGRGTQAAHATREHGVKLEAGR